MFLHEPVFFFLSGGLDSGQFYDMRPSVFTVYGPVEFASTCRRTCLAAGLQACSSAAGQPANGRVGLAPRV